MNTMTALFSALVFLAVFLLIRAIGSQVLVKVDDPEREFEREVLAKRGKRSDEPQLLRRPQLVDLSPLGRYLEAHESLRPLRRLIEQAGLRITAQRVLTEVGLCIVATGVLVALLAPMWWAFASLLPIAAALPVFRLLWLRSKRIKEIELQLADAIDMAKRSLRAGNPFISTFRLVSENMSRPISEEFALTAADLSYGNDPRSALLAMLERVPSVPLRGFVTAILVQRETGGNLAETLDHISEVIRQRFRFERKLRTLSAEGRLSAIILISIPFVLGGILHFTSPGYLDRLLDDPIGPSLLGGAGILMVIGVLWMRRIARVEI